MKRTVTLLAAAALTIGLAACGDDEPTVEETMTVEETTENTPNTGSPAAQGGEIDEQFAIENLPVVTGNIVTTVNNARGQESTPDGDLYDVGQYYDDLTTACKSLITRSEFRDDFVERVVPLIDEAQPERVTATVDGVNGIVRVEQVSSSDLLVVFDLSEGSGVERLECNDDGTVAIGTYA